MSDESPNSSLSRIFKIKMGLLAVGVIISLITVLAYVSTHGCPAYFLNFPMRTADCDLSNTLTMVLELTVAGIFAIILGLIFYQKQKGDSDKIVEINSKQIEQTSELTKINQRIDDLDFENKRLNALRIIIRHLNELKVVLERMKPTEKQGPFRSYSDIIERDQIIEKIEDVIDNVSLSRDPNYNLPFQIDRLLSEIKKMPRKEDISKIDEKTFLFQNEINFEEGVSKISTMETTLGGIQREIMNKAKKI